jgi:alpha-tubulin suppressor-like RCC1 family protein
MSGRTLSAALLLMACSERGPAAPPSEPPAVVVPAEPPPAAAPVAAPAQRHATIAAGVSHTCALVRGAVYCWGSNAHGQLGDGTDVDRTDPAPVPGLSDAIAVTAGTWHTCALRQVGEVLCWGDGKDGQIGDDRLGTRDRPSAAAGVRATAIAAGGDHTCAIGQDREVWCWGSNFRGQSGAGDGPIRRPTRVPDAPRADALAAGDDLTCALAAGEVWCWGWEPLRDRPGGPARVPGIAGAVQLSVGTGHACVVRDDGRALCWGTGRHGQLGDGRPVATEPARSPHAPPRELPRLAEVADLKDVAAVTLGGEFACALRRTGEVACWGEGRDGKLGDGSLADYHEPVAVPGLRDVIELAAGSAHACARDRAGALRCWGYNEDGQAGPRPPEPALPGASRFALAATGVAVGESHACAWSQTAAWCWGDNTYGQLGDGTRERRVVPTAVVGLAGARELVAGDRHTCALEHGGTVQCWGDDTFGQLAAPGVPSGEPFDEHTGPLPLPPIDARSRPRPGPVAGLRDVVDLSVLAHHTCAVRSTGGVVCWHAFEQQPLTTERPLGAVEMAAGAAHDCVRLRSGEVRCWGTNHTGRLGDGTTVRKDGVVAVKDLADATALAAGRLHTCALRKDGRVACWGDGFSGQLGDGTRADRAAPTTVAGLRGATALTAGEDTTCAIGQGRKLMCWGANTGGQLGDGTHGDRYKPVAARIDPTTAVAVGERAACAVTTTGLVACWGDGLSSAERRWAFAARPQPIALP